MSSSDLTIVTIAVVIFVTYGTFLYMYANETQTQVNSTAFNSSQFTTPESSGFLDTLTEIGSMSTSEPELFFINTILFGTIGFMLLFVGLRYLRGV